MDRLTESRISRQMDGLTDKQKDRSVDGQTYGERIGKHRDKLMDRDRKTNKRMVVLTEREREGLSDRRLIDKWIDGQTNKWTDRPIDSTDRWDLALCPCL